MNRLYGPPAAVVAGVVLLATFSFVPLRKTEFLGDDHPIVRQNTVVRSGDYRSMLTKPYWWGVGGNDTTLYRPVTLASFAVQRDPGGQVDPHRARRVNVVLHVVCSVLLYALARRAGAATHTAAVAAWLFAAHPIHVAAIAPLVGRADVLALGFMLLAALLQAGSFARLPDVAARWLSAGCTLAALGSKESAIAGPLIVAAVELAARPRGGAAVPAWLRGRLAALIPTALAVLAWIALRAHATGGWSAVPVVPVSENPLAAAGGIGRWGTALAVLTRYLGLLAFPRTLSGDYSGNVIPLESAWYAPRVLLGAAALVVLAASSLAPFVRRERTAVSSGSARWSWSLAAWLFLFPYLVISNLLVPVGMLFAERFAYAPSAGFCLLAALAVTTAVARLAPAPRAATLAIAIGAVAAAAGSWRSNVESRHWITDESLHARVLHSQPASPRAAFTLGMIRLQQGREQEAVDLFRRAIDNYPSFSAAWFEIGKIHLRGGRLAEAAAAFQQAEQINPYNPEMPMGRGDALAGLGRWQEAAEAYRAAAKLGYPGAAQRQALAESRAAAPRP